MQYSGAAGVIEVHVRQQNVIHRLGRHALGRQRGQAGAARVAHEFEQHIDAGSAEAGRQRRIVEIAVPLDLRLTLAPLVRDDLAQFIADALRCEARA